MTQIVEVQMPPRRPEFNAVFVEALDETLTDAFDVEACTQFHNIMLTKYGVTQEELPYRLDTICSLLETAFNVREVQDMEKSIGRRLSAKLGLRFKEDKYYFSLRRHIEYTKEALGKSN